MQHIIYNNNRKKSSYWCYLMHISLIKMEMGEGENLKCET